MLHKRRRERNREKKEKKSHGNYKKNYFCFIDYAKAFDCVDHNKLWKILKEMGICRSGSNS